jgi:hypothetical protein
MYIVVFRNVSGSISNGVITWTCFEDKEQFNNWWLNSKNAKNWYEIVEEGVTEQRAIKLSSSLESRLAGLLGVATAISEIEGSLQSLDSVAHQAER